MKKVVKISTCANRDDYELVDVVTIDTDNKTFTVESKGKKLSDHEAILWSELFGKVVGVYLYEDPVQWASHVTYRNDGYTKIEVEDIKE